MLHSCMVLLRHFEHFKVLQGWFSSKHFVVQGYMVGTFLYFAIVFSLPICMGLAAIAMDLPVRMHVVQLHTTACN